MSRRTALAVAPAAVAATAVALAALRVAPLTAELCILCLLVGGGLFARLPRLRTAAPAALAWSLWLAAVVALDDMRALQRVGPRPHEGDVAALESSLPGGLAVVHLQQLWGSGGLRWYDLLLAVIYLMHSPAPLLAGAGLWRWRRDLFAPFVASMLICGAIGLAVYLVFPEAPPWLAAEHGVIPPVRRISSEVIAHVGPLNAVYGGADPLPNAAMPSLHVAYPLIVAWWTIAAAGRRALPLLLYPLVLAVGVVYLGEHWAVDSLAGVICAGVAITAVEAVRRRRSAPG